MNLLALSRYIKPDLKDGVPLLAWKENGKSVFPLMRLGSGAFFASLPGEHCVLTADELKDGLPIKLIFSEQRSGGGQVIDFCVEALKAELNVAKAVAIDRQHCRIDLTKHEQPSGHEKEQKQPSGHEKEQKSPSVPELLTAFLTESDLTAREGALKALCKHYSPQNPLYLLIHRLEALGDAAWFGSFCSTLRSFFDENPNPALRLIVTTSDANVSSEFWIRSGLDTVSDTYRQASFQVVDLQTLARAQRKHGTRDLPGLHLVTEQAEQLVEWCGGQPLLIQRCLTWLALAGKPDPEGRPDDLLDIEPSMQPKQWIRPDQALLNRLYQEAFRVPPREAALWKTQLDRLLAENRGLRSLLEPYVQGQTRILGDTAPPIGYEELPLYLAGWLGVNRLGRWGIRSPLHQAWAREVLLQRRDV